MQLIHLVTGTLDMVNQQPKHTSTDHIKIIAHALPCKPAECRQV